MKRFFALILMALLLLSFAACSESESNQSADSDAVSNDASDEAKPECISKAQALIKEGKYAEAYAILYPERENEDVRAMLDEFLVVHTLTDSKVYNTYNYVKETEYNEYGDVISAKISYPNFSDGDATLIYEYVYDTNGNFLKMIESYEDEDFEKVTEYEYDEQNRLVKTIDERGTVENVYNENGEIVKVIETREDGDVTEETYTYDENGNVLTEFVCFNGEFYSSHEYTYVYNDHKDITNTHDAYSVLFYGEIKISEYESSYEYEYDELGRKTKIVSEGNAGKKTEEFVYNDQGDVVKQTESMAEITRVDEYEYTYGADGKKLKERLICNSWSSSSLEEKYDEHGNIVLRQTEDTLVTHEYTYDENGFIIKDIETIDNEDNYGKIIVNTIEYTNDEKGRVLKSVGVDEKGKTYTKEFTYDSEDRILKETWTEEYGEYSNTYYIDERTYDEHGNVLTYYHKYYESEDSYNCTYVYDNNGNVLERKKDGVTIIKYTYDANGNQIKTEFYPDGKLSEINDSEYDDKGNIIKSVQSDADGKVIYTKESVYDAKGNLVKDSVVKGESEVEKFIDEYVHEYTYDELGNVLTYFMSETDLNGYETSFSEYTYSGYEYYYKGSING